MPAHRKYRVPTVAALGILLTLSALAGCKAKQPRSDQQVAADVQAKLQGESALNGQNIQVSVSGGIATLNGTVSDQASRALAANDIATIDGVKTVVNNLTVQPGQESAAQPAPMPEPQNAPSPQPLRNERRDRAEHRQQQPGPTPGQDQNNHQSANMPQPPAPVAPPPPPPAPVAKEVTLPAGTVVPVRLTETLDSKDAQPNGVFHGAIASDIGTQGVIAVPRGTPVVGRIVDAHEAAHFKGASMLSIELTRLQLHGQPITLVTDSYVKEGAARGKNTAVKAGGGAALGAIIGAIAGGGKGAAIGTLAGGAAGAGVNAATRGQQTVIPTESVVNFQLQSPITVTVPPPGTQDSEDEQDPQLQHRQP